MTDIMEKENYFNYVESTLGDDTTSFEKLVATHQHLGNFTVDFYGQSTQAGVEFVKAILNCPRFSPTIPAGVKEFINSDYLSSIFSKQILALADKMPDYKEMKPFLISKRVSDYSLPELQYAGGVFKDYGFRFKNTGIVDTFGYSDFMQYMFFLDSDAARALIPKNLSSQMLGRMMLENSGLMATPFHYPTKESRIEDLNENHMFAIYEKMVRFLPEHAEEYLKLIDCIDNLNAAEFIKNFNFFVENDFSCEGLNIQKCPAPLGIKCRGPFVSAILERVAIKVQKDYAIEEGNISPEADKELREKFKTKVKEYNDTLKKKELKHNKSTDQ